ncbi:SLC13 family permease, partial [Campylobacter coli]|nr:SLC13 family permease [Campylobacter coli]
YKERENVINEYLINAKVLNNSSLVGKTIQENGLRNLEFLFLLEIQRKDELITPVSHNELIKEGDELIFSGDITHLEALKKFDGLQIGSQDLKLETLNLIDVVINSESNLIGKSVKEANFRAKFDAGIVALKRGSKNISKIG